MLQAMLQTTLSDRNLLIKRRLVVTKEENIYVFHTKK